MARHIIFIVALSILYCLFGIASAQSPSASFAYPRTPTGTTPLLIINVIDTVVVQWASNFQEAYLWLFCDVGTADNPSIGRWANLSVASTGRTSFLPFFNIDVARDWKRPYSCHFDLNYEDSYDKAINGPLFNITSVASQKATTYALEYTTTALPSSGVSRTTVVSITRSDSLPNEPSSTTMLNAPNAPSIPTTLNATSQPTASMVGTAASSNSNNGLSPGAKAGIAIGAVTGLIALLALGFMVRHNKRKVDKLQSRLSGVCEKGYQAPQNVEASSPYRDNDTYKQAVVTKLEPSCEPHELPEL